MSENKYKNMDALIKYLNWNDGAPYYARQFDRLLYAVSIYISDNEDKLRCGLIDAPMIEMIKNWRDVFMKTAADNEADDLCVEDIISFTGSNFNSESHE